MQDNCYKNRQKIISRNRVKKTNWTIITFLLLGSLILGIHLCFQIQINEMINNTLSVHVYTPSEYADFKI